MERPWPWWHHTVSHNIIWTVKSYLPTLSCLPYAGELFDHGFDSWSTIFLPMSCYSNLGLGRWVGGVDDVYLPCVAGMVGFYCTHWEKYITGTLYLPWAYDITMLVGILMQTSMVCSQYTSDCMKYLLGGWVWVVLLSWYNWRAQNHSAWANPISNTGNSLKWTKMK